MNLVTAIFLLITLLVSVSTDQEITSTGNHSSEEFLWAVGVDNLRFNISFPGLDSSNYGSYGHTWSHVWSDNTTIVSFQTAAIGSDPSDIDCYYGIKYDNPPTHTAYGVDYRIDCTLVGSTLETQFSILSPLNSSYNGTLVKVERAGFSFMKTQELQMEYCPELRGSGYLKISGGLKAEYDSESIYTCTDSALVVDGTYDKNINNYSRTCNYDAKWSNPGSKVDCWFAPTASISIEQNGNTFNGNLISEESCTINCSISMPGNPGNASPTYYKDRKQIGDIFNVTSIDDGANVSCQMSNSYVNEVDNATGYSTSITLNVLYQPEAVDGNLSVLQSASVGQNYTIMITFNANPILSLSNTAMFFKGQELNSSNATISDQGTLQTYRYPLSAVSNDSFGIYTLMTESPEPQLAGRVTNFTVTLTSMELSTTTSMQNTTIATSMPNTTIMTVTTSTPTDAADSNSTGAPEQLSPGIIAAIALGGVAVIGMLVGGIWIWKRRSSKNNLPSREERDNPLYGTTPINRIDEEYATVNKKKKKKEKQEKINPLYQSSQETNGATIEPAYGSVGQERDTNEAGPSSSTVNPNTSEVTYAAVSKPKKNKKSRNSDSTTNQDNIEVTYAAVNKPKKKDKTDTTDSTVDPNTSEVTYAAVNKPKKNN